MNQPGSGWAKQFRSCCVVNFTLTSKQEEQGCMLERLPLPKSILHYDICIIKGCFCGLQRTCLGGCCPKHTKQYGKKGPPEIMKRTKTYQRRDLQVEESSVSTIHKIMQWTTRRRLSDSEPWDYEIKYYNTNDTSWCSRGTQICIDHGNQYKKCTLGCAPCKHGENHPRRRCKDCYPELKCRTKDCDSIKSQTANDDTEGLCAYCINDMTGNLTIEQINHKHLKELGYSLRTGFKHPSLTYFIDGTMMGKGDFDELNWENDEGNNKEGHSCNKYTTNAHQWNIMSLRLVYLPNQRLQ